MIGHWFDLVCHAGGFVAGMVLLCDSQDDRPMVLGGAVVVLSVIGLVSHIFAGVWG